MFKEIFSTLAVSGGIILTTLGKLEIDKRRVGWFERFIIGASMGAFYATTFPISIPIGLWYGSRLYKSGELIINGKSGNEPEEKTD